MDAKLKSKIEKLLALQESPNEHEAAIAAAKLSDLLTRHNLDLAEVVDGSNEQAERFYVYPSNRVPTWRFLLFTAIADVNYCECVLHKRSSANGLYFYGRPTNVMTANLLCEYLCQAIDRLTKRYTTGEGLSYATNFRLGCAKRIAFRLRQAHKQKLEGGIAGSADSPSVSAIVCLSLDKKLRDEANAAIEAYSAKNNVKNKGPRQWSLGNKPGVAEGMAAGDTVSLSPQIKSNQLKALGGA